MWFRTQPPKIACSQVVVVVVAVVVVIVAAIIVVRILTSFTFPKDS